MKRLMIMRHGKSDWNTAVRSDHARPLAMRGERSATAMGAVLARSGETPDLVITSTARRARDTAALAATGGGWACPVTEEDRLYGASAEGMLGVAMSAGDRVHRLLLVGHEPTCGELVHLLTGGVVQMKTATTVALDVAIDAWEELPGADATIAWVLQPRLFTDHDLDPG